MVGQPMAENTCEGCGDALPDNYDTVCEPMSGEGFPLCHTCSGRKFLPDNSDSLVVEHQQGKYDYEDEVIVKDKNTKVTLTKERLRIEDEKVECGTTFTSIKLYENEDLPTGLKFEDTDRDKHLWVKENFVSNDGIRVFSEKIFRMVGTAILAHSQKTPNVMRTCDRCHHETARSGLEDGECWDCRRDADQKVTA